MEKKKKNKVQKDLSEYETALELNMNQEEITDLGANKALKANTNNTKKGR